MQMSVYKSYIFEYCKVKKTLKSLIIIYYFKTI